MQDAKGRPLGGEARRKWCDIPANIAGAAFQPGHVYTFHFWQHYADFGQYRLGIVSAGWRVQGAQIAVCQACWWLARHLQPASVLLLSHLNAPPAISPHPNPCFVFPAGHPNNYSPHHPASP